MENYFNLFLTYFGKFNRFFIKLVKFILVASVVVICAFFTVGVVLFVYSGAFDGFVILFGWCIEIDGQCSSNVYYDFMKWLHVYLNHRV